LAFIIRRERKAEESEGEDQIERHELREGE